MTPFSGVRISWLMLARKADFCRDASMALSRASTSSPSARSRRSSARASTMMPTSRMAARGTAMPRTVERSSATPAKASSVATAAVTVHPRCSTGW
jgi:hypothetical protein